MTPKPPATIPLDERRSSGEHIVDVLATLHLIDPDDVGLGTLARKEAYIERQLKRWTKQWEATKTHEIPEMEESERLLHEDMPEQIGSAIVHGDYRIGNMIIRDGRMAALLDWELCTLGDPLADLGYLLNNWIEPGDKGAEGNPTGVGGFPGRDHVLTVYQERTGRDLSRINYYRAFPTGASEQSPKASTSATSWARWAETAISIWRSTNSASTNGRNPH